MQRTLFGCWNGSQTPKDNKNKTPPVFQHGRGERPKQTTPIQMKKPNRIAGNGDTAPTGAQAKPKAGNSGKTPSRNPLQHAGECWIAHLAKGIGASSFYEDALLSLRSGIAVEIDGRFLSKKQALALFSAAAKTRADIQIEHSPLTTAEFCASAKKFKRSGRIVFNRDDAPTPRFKEGTN